MCCNNTLCINECSLQYTALFSNTDIRTSKPDAEIRWNNGQVIKFCIDSADLFQTVIILGVRVKTIGEPSIDHHLVCNLHSEKTTGLTRMYRTIRGPIPNKVGNSGRQGSGKYLCS